jgi:PIN domain nuclease of toxin-antitoxin system
LANDLRCTLPRLLAEAKPHKLAHSELDISALLNSAIASAGEQARRLLSAMAICAPSGFRLSLAAEIAGTDDESALDTLQDLRSRSLVDVVHREKLRCHLHSLIRAEAGQDSGLEENHAAAIARRFETWEESWRECEEDLDDWRLALAWAADENVPPSERIGLLMALADSGFRFTYRRGLLTDALWAMESAAPAFENVGDRARLQASYGNQALILGDWGRREDAMARHKKEEATGLELGDRAGLQVSYNNQAVILRAWGRLEDAMALHKKQEAICLELGDRAGLQASHGNQASILYAWGRLEEARALHKKQEAICRELGLRDGLRISLHNQAIFLEAMGQADEASRLRTEAEAIQAELMRGREASA